MKIKHFVLLFILLVSFASCESKSPNAAFIESPNREVQFYFKVTPEGELYYATRFNYETIFKTSRLGLSLEGVQDFETKWSLESTGKASQGQLWSPVWGPKEYIKEYYKEQTIKLLHKDKGYQLHIRVRVSNDGIAFAYHIPKQDALKQVKVTKEFTQFAFGEDRETWYKANDKPYEKTYLRQLDQVSLPLYASLESKKLSNRVRVFSAGLEDYPNISLKRVAGRDIVYNVELDKVKSSGLEVLTTPWRVVQIGKDDKVLFESNFALNLNPEPELQGYDWVRPTKYWKHTPKAKDESLAEVVTKAKNQGISTLFMEDVAGLTAKDTKRLEVDSMWLMRSVRLEGLSNLVQSMEKLLHSRLRYIKLSMSSELRSQFTSLHYDTLIGWAKERQIMLSLDSRLVISGLSRPYPHIVYHNTEKKANNLQLMFDFLNGQIEQTLEQPFPVQVAQGDYNTLARYIISGSPLQQTVDVLSDKLEGLDLVRTLPVEWKDTQVIDAKMGSHLAVARKDKHSYDWYVGAVNARYEEKELVLSTKFLPVGYRYQVYLYCSTDKGESYLRHAPESIPIESNQELTLVLPSAGGCAARIKFLGE